MKKEINLNGFIQEFKNYGRDYYSIEGYQALFDYYDEIDFELDVITICCEVSEFNKKEMLREYKHLDCEDIDELVDYLEKETTVIKLDDDAYLVWSY